MGATVSSTVTPRAATNSSPRISPQPPQTSGDPTSKMSLDHESHAQDELSHNSLMGLHELDTQFSFLDETETASSKDQPTALPLSPIPPSISNKNVAGIHSSIEPALDDALSIKSSLNAEVHVAAINDEGRPKKKARTSK